MSAAAPGLPAPPGPGGIVVVDKPAGWTSHDVVARLRRAFGTRRVGHAGTLDPAATGVLVVGVDWATKLLTYATGTDKTYAATIRLGMSTTTDDAEGEPVGGADASGIRDEAVLAAVADLTGPIAQRPSAVSAIKVDGRRAYARVRAGEDVVLPERPVTVHRFDVDHIRRAGGTVDLDVTVSCSSGTYIRALARDLGAALGVGGHLTALRRLRVGPWTVEEARDLPDLVAAGRPALVPLATAARRLLPHLDLDAAAVRALRFGQAVQAADEPDAPAAAALGPDGELVALVAVRAGRLLPLAVAPQAVAPQAVAPQAVAPQAVAERPVLPG